MILRVLCWSCCSLCFCSNALGIFLHYLFSFISFFDFWCVPDVPSLLLRAQFRNYHCVIGFNCVVSVSFLKVLWWRLKHSAGIFLFPTTFFLLVQCHSGANLKCCVLQDSSSSFQIFALPCDSFLKLGEYCCIPSFLHLHCFPCVTEVASSLMILAQFRSDLPYWVHMWCFSFFLLESSLMKSEQFCSDIGFPSCVLLTFA